MDVHVIDLARELLITVLLLSGPVLIVGLIVGVAVSLFQALTSVQEQTLSLIPKMFAVIGVTTDSGRLVIRHEGETVADMPVPPLADDAPNYDRPYEPSEKPAVLDDPTVTFKEAEAVLRAPGKSDEEMRTIA